MVERINSSPPIPFGRKASGQGFPALAGTDAIHVHPHTPGVPDGDCLGAKAKLFGAASTPKLHRNPPSHKAPLAAVADSGV